ncbi:MAG: hypothetical protein IPG56_20570 [Caulobacteraceae bacterium]|nr:hypothetical protein [Caulobacteraceae bacterium]
MAKTDTTDPYAPPPMHHDRSGPVLRVALLAGLLGLAGLGYAWLAGQERTALVPEAAQEQQVADAGYTVDPTPVPETVTESLPPTATPTPAPAQRRAAAPARTAEPPPEVDTVPPAVTPVPAQPTPLPPIDVPPATGTVGE